MLCLSGFELYSRWVPLKRNRHEGLKIKTKTSNLLCSRFFGRFLCHPCMTSIVKLDWNGNAIIALLI